MNLYHPWHLLLLVVILPLVLMLARLNRKRIQRFSRFAEPQFMQDYLSGHSPFYQGLKSGLLILALAFVVFALLRPQWDFVERDYESQGLDILICLDLSKSMDAEDMAPSRLQRAKLQTSSFIGKLRGDRVGIIAFAGAATLECPLTDDYESASLVLNSLSTDTVVQFGTDIGAALSLAERGFQASGGSNILLLITDGEDLENAAIAQAKRLGAAGIRIYAMGVGTEEGIWIEDPATGRKAFSKLNSQMLREIAAAGNGQYYNITPGQSELDAILQNIYRTEKGRESSRNVSLLKDQFPIPATLALLVLVLEALILPLRKRRRQA
ncbi:MAG: VWA domain-containing protein [Candidatus Syntrophosphaera sp.]|nr:VWA domain-containing protein [Candidatus Syntrophosphaera sp.]